MNKSDIESYLKEYIKEKIKVDLEEVDADYRTNSLLSPQIGFAPRDLLVIFFEMQKHYSIRFVEEDITERRFDMLPDIAESIYRKIYDKPQEIEGS